MLARKPLRTVSLTLASTFTHPAVVKTFSIAVLRADDQKVDHIAGIAGFIGDAARNFGEESLSTPRMEGTDFSGVEDSVGIGGVNLNANGIRAVASVAAELIDADREAAGDGRHEVAFCADEKRLRGVLVADAANDRAASGFVERQIAQKILEAASHAGGSGVGLLVGVAKRSGRRGDHVFARLHIDASVHPGRIPGELNFLRHAELAGRSGCSR